MTGLLLIGLPPGASSCGCGRRATPSQEYNGWRRYELPTVESQAVPVRGAHTFLDRGRLHPRGMSS